MQKKSASDPLGGFLAIVVVAFALYTLQNLPALMAAMDRATNLTP